MSLEEMVDIEQNIPEPMILKKYTPEDFKTWILNEFHTQRIEDTTPLNDKLWLLPQSKLKQELAKHTGLKSPYVLAIIYTRVLKKNPKATVMDFANELATVMPKLEAKHQAYSSAKGASEDKFSRLRDLFALYTDAKSTGTLPKISKVLLRPTGLKTCEPGVYSLDLKFGNKDRVIANDLRVIDPEIECLIPEKPPFECEVSKRLDLFSVDLYDFKGDLLSTGSSWIFARFPHSIINSTKTEFSCTSSIVNDGRKDFVEVDATYLLTYDMSAEVLNEHRAEVELFLKKLAQKVQGLDEAITTISQAFPHIGFNKAQSCFLHIDKVGDEDERKARELRQAAVASEKSSRIGCDCCSLL